MTRFARAKGSKASNEKLPEEASSWAELKKSVLSSPTKPEESPSQVLERMKEVKAVSHNQTEWAPMENDTVEDYFSIIRQHHRKGDNTEGDVQNNVKESGSKKKKLKKKQMQSPSDSTNTDSKTTDKPLKPSKKIKKLDKQCDDDHESVSKKGKKRKNESNMEESNSKKVKSNVGEGVESDKKIQKKKLKKKKVKDTGTDNLSEKQTVSKGENKKEKGEKKKIKNFSGGSLTSKKGNLPNGRKEKFSKKNKFSNDKNMNFNSKKDIDKRNRFRKNDFSMDTVEQIMINGEKVKIVKFQGFNVLLDDAERLKKLKADMFKEGIPRKQLEAALKLERRRAEKALARLKKAVCFHCRGAGHVLSQCPSLTESQNTGTGICYKCGSTEHTALECKVIRGSSFQFAECFICKEQGHIARQCPDNPRGLYPQGGGCRECGDVTHLRKDCPKTISKKEEQVVTLGVANSRNVESLDEELDYRRTKTATKTPSKKSPVKF